MTDVHERVRVLRQKLKFGEIEDDDPIRLAAAEIAEESWLLCFDEFHVTDIADAMILGRLFKALFEAQVVVVATSNVPPHELYKDGLNRALFLPFIELIERHRDIEKVVAARDFRLEKLAGKPLYFTPAGAKARAAMDRMWLELSGGQLGSPTEIDVKGRSLKVPQAALGLARFSFAELCEQPLGTIDYLALTQQFHTVFIDDIPVMVPARRDVARRFVNLIDTLYDARIGLIASAEAEPDGLYPAGDVHFLFERTVSRLIEMRSEAFLAGRGERMPTPPPGERDGRSETKL
jgi:cell division protein ZapE